MTFRVGQKVVCISSRLVAIDADDDRPDVKIGFIYTVRQVREGFRKELGSSILVEEIISPMGERSELGFYAARFRPIVERKTDISFAHEILRKTSQGVDA